MHYLQTTNGYGFFEASSAFQKGIRRGDEKVSMFFMVELYLSGYEEYLWKRIKIITSEDIGLSAPSAAAAIAALYANYSEMKKENKDTRAERIFLVHATLFLCRCKKSRYVDYAMIKYFRGHMREFKKMDIPDYAFDKHTAKGKQLGRGAEHFYQEGAFIENAFVQPGEEEIKKEAFALVQKYPGKLSFPARGKKGEAAQETIFPED